MTPKARRLLLDRYRVETGERFRLPDHNPADTAGGIVDRDAAEALLAEGVQQLADLQTRLYAARRWSVLIILQGMDASGKGGTIKHVLSGVNPQGVAVTSFSAPGPEELGHDFLWRIHRALPMRGQIGIFDRSHYEEVLVVRVHPELLAKQSLPDPVAGKDLWRHRLEDIAAFERYLVRQGTVVLKFFLNLSKEEQRRRLLARLEEPDKHWKFDAGDLAARSQWEQYMAAFEAAIAATAAPHAPWLVVPADRKWFARLVVVEAINDALSALDLSLPTLDAARAAVLEQARRQLKAETRD